MFIKIRTKLRQKLKYRDQIENEKMTRGEDKGIHMLGKGS